MMEVNFLSVEEVIQMHDGQIALRGGRAGIMDLGLIRSAVAQPQAMFDGNFLNPTISLMAAALCRSLAQNHGFNDGNKRTAVVATKAFLAINDILLCPSNDDMYTFVLKVAQGLLTKEQMAEFIELNSVPIKVPDG